MTPVEARYLAGRIVLAYRAILEDEKKGEVYHPSPIRVTLTSGVHLRVRVTKELIYLRLWAKGEPGVEQRLAEVIHTLGWGTCTVTSASGEPGYVTLETAFLGPPPGITESRSATVRTVVDAAHQQEATRG